MYPVCFLCSDFFVLFGAAVLDHASYHFSYSSIINAESGPPRSVQVVDNRVVVWQKPDTSNGNITGYDVGISTTPEPTPDLITIVGRINDAEQNFFVINSDDVSASITYVQVRIDDTTNF